MYVRKKLGFQNAKAQNLTRVDVSLDFGAQTIL